ncbi:MAG: 4-alpha-glucanotransferase, partial [Muribaculaceae bacterium]|nr:4-alpha-glucanotransferase [Muribaculaceae bacterium]
MKLTFHVDYRTQWGESLYIYGSIPALGNNVEDDAVKMSISDSEHWIATIDVPDDVKSIDYNYVVRNENGSIKHEWGQHHVFHLPSKVETAEIFDRWQDQPWDKPYYSSAFTECICKRESRAHKLTPAKGKIQIQVIAPMVKPDEVLAICGSADELGAWDAGKAVVMNDASYPIWSVNLPAKGLTASTEYKFVILRAETRELVAWESGSNRFIGINLDADKATVIAGLRFISPLAPWKGAGTAIPVFSIRTDKDFGVGDFGDLFDMVDWCVETGQTFLQILPINDTTMTHTWTDSYPYNANSTFALHPMYLRLTELGVLDDADRQAYYDNLGRELNSLAEIDYERVTEGKLEFAREIFAQNGKQVVASKDFKEFVKRNEYWLKPYAVFCVLRDKFGTPYYNLWGEYAEYNEAKIERFVCDNTY